jgi:hypothetical protein
MATVLAAWEGSCGLTRRNLSLRTCLSRIHRSRSEHWKDGIPSDAVIASASRLSHAVAKPIWRSCAGTGSYLPCVRSSRPNHSLWTMRLG